MNYDRGFAALKAGLAQSGPNLQSELATFEERFHKNERAERLFGGSESTRNERSQIVYALNELALMHLGISFNDLCAGAEAPPRPAPLVEPTPAAAPAVLRIRFQVQLTRPSASRLEVRALDTPMGQPRARGRLPFSEEELAAVLKALRLHEYRHDLFTPAQHDLLARLDLLIAGKRLAPNVLARVGQALYRALLPGEVGIAFRMALSMARDARAVVALQLRFDEDAVELACYPWELLHYRRPLLPSGAVELTRYISYPEAVPPLSVAPPLRLLYVRCRPSDVPALSDVEQTAVREALSGLEQEGLLQVDTLATATFESLQEYFESHKAQPAHLLHFDGHGAYARLCPACGALNYARQGRCQARRGEQTCGQSLAAIAPEGYLAFEGPGRRTDLVTSAELGTVLYNSPVRLAVLSACWSGAVSGETLFGGVGPALIQAGLPAVVSTQLPTEEGAAASFAEGFYRALAHFETVPAAVNAGRARMLRSDEWFIPVLYLRSKDDEGRLFAR